MFPCDETQALERFLQNTRLAHSALSLCSIRAKSLSSRAGTPNASLFCVFASSAAVALEDKEVPQYLSSSRRAMLSFARLKEFDRAKHSTTASEILSPVFR